MEWTQVFIILPLVLVSAYAFFSMMTEKTLNRINIQLIKMEQEYDGLYRKLGNIEKTLERLERIELYHRKNMERIDIKFMSMDEKWERLFEKMWIKEQGKC